MSNKRKAATLAAIVITILLTAREPSQTEYRLYFPIAYATDYGECVYSEKKGLAYSYPYQQGISEAIRQDVCIKPNSYWRTWGYHRPNIYPNLTFVPTVWGRSQYDNFRSWYDDSKNITYLLIGNECDQVDQCNLTPYATALLFIDVLGTCPTCLAIGPGLASDETDGAWLLEWYYAYLQLGGDISRLYAWDAHQYLHPTDAIPHEVYQSCFGKPIDDPCIATVETQRRIDRLYQVMPLDLPLFISEVGVCQGFLTAYNWFGAVLDVLESDPRVIAYLMFLDIGVGQPWQPCNFPIYTDGRLNAYGLAMRHAGSIYVLPGQPPPYP